MKDEELIMAMKMSSDNFNNLPIEMRKRLASPYERLLEVDIAIDMAKKHLEELKKRKRNLERWLVDWYHEQAKSNKS